MDEIEIPKWLFSKYPIVCTLCGGSFEYKDKRIIYPYPTKHYLCFGCFKKSMDEGLGRLNKRLAAGDINLSVDDIADEIKPHRARNDIRRQM